MASASLPELGVVGWPLDTTFSPQMHQAALDITVPGWRYERLPVPADGLDAFVEQARTMMCGFNITMPHKAAICELCDSVDELSSVSGAVNTVVFRQGKMLGYNTDGPGLLRALYERACSKPDGTRAVILGAGGAASSCAASLAGQHAAEILIINRTAARAQDLCERLSSAFPDTRWLGEGHRDGGQTQADLIVSCVPESGALVYESILQSAPQGAVFMDMSYSAQPSHLYQTAKKRGLTVVPGLEMLLWQAVEAFHIFTGKPAPAKSMRAALVAVAGRWWV